MSTLEPLEARGRSLVEAGLGPERIAVDLDETLWEWGMALLQQPTLWADHRETIFLRRPFLRLLLGMVRAGGSPVRSWTAGYGTRMDRIGHRSPEAAEVLGLGPGLVAESLPYVVTRLDWSRALQRRPALAPSGGSIISQKVPGAPTAAGKPLVDAARVLLDDKETNCRRFVSAGDGRSAVWLKGTGRSWSRSVRWRRLAQPGARTWVDGIVEAFEAVAAGQVGLFIAEPRAWEGPVQGLEVRLPHDRVWREFVEPARAIQRRVAAGRPR